MSTIRTVTFTVDELNAEVNRCKDIFIQNMVNEKIITQNQKNKLDEYAIVIHSKSMFGKFWEKLWKSDTDKTALMISSIKILN